MTAQVAPIGYDPVTGEFYSSDGSALSYEEGRQMAAEYFSTGYFVAGISDSENGTGILNDTGPAIFPAAVLTAEQNQQHLDAVASAIAADLGLSNIPKSSWTQAQRIQYIDSFRTKLLDNPEQFLPQTLAIADRINTSDWRLDTTANFEKSIVDLVAPAAQAAQAPADLANGIINALAGLGKGLSLTGALAPFLIPIAVIGFLYVATSAAATDPGRYARKIF